MPIRTFRTPAKLNWVVFNIHLSAETAALAYKVTKFQWMLTHSVIPSNLNNNYLAKTQVDLMKALDLMYIRTIQDVFITFLISLASTAHLFLHTLKDKINFLFNNQRLTRE
jgi:hypothetical protein